MTTEDIVKPLHDKYLMPRIQIFLSKDGYALLNIESNISSNLASMGKVNREYLTSLLRALHNLGQLGLARHKKA